MQCATDIWLGFLRRRDPSRRPGSLLAVAAVLAIIWASPAHGREAVAVRAGIHAGFGRLVLEWPAPVEVAGAQEGSRYRLRFGRPLEASLEHAVGHLAAYLQSTQLGPDGRELALDLAPGVAVRQTLEDGRIVVLDLVAGFAVRQAGPEGRVVVLDLSPPRARAAVEVRAGRHDGFGRVVFDWPVPTGFEAVRTGRQLTVRFDRAGDVDVSKLAVPLGAWLGAAGASRSDGRSEVRLELRPGVNARVFKVDESRVAVDLTGPPARPSAPGVGSAAQASSTPRVGSINALPPWQRHRLHRRGRAWRRRLQPQPRWRAPSRRPSSPGLRRR